MLPARLDITILRGDPFKKTYTVFEDDGKTVVDLTGYSARFSLKKEIGGKVYISYDSVIDMAELFLTELEGKINLSIPQDTTKTLDYSEAVHELELINASGERQTLIQGLVILKKDVITNE